MFDWIKRHALALMGGLAGLLGAILFWRYRGQQLRTARARAQLAEATANARALQAKRESILAQIGNDQTIIDELEYEKTVAREQAIAKAAEIQDADGEELRRRLAKLYD